jgi:hypothetical protein
MAPQFTTIQIVTDACVCVCVCVCVLFIHLPIGGLNLSDFFPLSKFTQVCLKLSEVIIIFCTQITQFC